jgi:hypothetical protein
VNTASYVICLSLILVIHHNMTNETNNIVEHVFVDISRSQGCKKCHMPKWGDSIFFKGLNWRKKKRNDNVRWTKGTLEEGVGAKAGSIGTLRRRKKDNKHYRMNWR